MKKVIDFEQTQEELELVEILRSGWVLQFCGLHDKIFLLKLFQNMKGWWSI